MKPELWAGVAACLLGIAAVAGGLAMFQARGSWIRISTIARTAGVVALVASLVSGVVLQGTWSPFDLQQVVLGLALAMLIIHLAMAWRLRTSGAGLVVDVVALLLVLFAAIALRPGAPTLTRVQRSVLFWFQWALFLLGSGGVLVAGSTGVMLVLRKGLAGLGWDSRESSRADLYDLLTEATFLALVAIGSGLTVGVWWAWQTVGTLTSGDPRQAWMAVTWLVCAMGLSAWHLQRWRGRWAAGLAIMSAVVVLVALLTVANGQRLLSM